VSQLKRQKQRQNKKEKTSSKHIKRNSLMNKKMSILVLGLAISLARHVLLAPRTELTPTPYALYAQTAGSLAGAVADSQLSANIPRLNANPNFTGRANFSPASGAPFAVGNTVKVNNLNADLLDGLDPTAFVLKAGDTMTGRLNLPVNGLVAGTGQLVLSGGKVGIGTTNRGAPLHVRQGSGSGVNDSGFASDLGRLAN